MDAACVVKNDDVTQKVDMAKCHDGKKSAATEQVPADSAKNVADATKAPDSTTTTATGKAALDTQTTASTSLAVGDILI